MVTYYPQLPFKPFSQMKHGAWQHQEEELTLACAKSGKSLGNDTKLSIATANTDYNQILGSQISCQNNRRNRIFFEGIVSSTAASLIVVFHDKAANVGVGKFKSTINRNAP